MLELIIFIFLLVGGVYLLNEASIFDKPRNWIKSKSKFLNNLLSCPNCCSFWVGIGIHFLYPITDIFLITGIMALGIYYITQKLIEF